MKTLLSLTLLLFVSMGTSASDLSQAAPKLALPDKSVRFVDRSYGFEISIPRHFELTGDEAGLLYFQSSEKPGLLIVRPAPGMGLQNVQQLMRNGFESRVTRLRTKGAPMSMSVANGQGMAMAVEGDLQGQPVAGYLAGIFGRGGQGYVVLIGAIANKWPILEPESFGILESFALISPEPGHEHERWVFRLAGKHLAFVEGYGMTFEGALFSSEITLCRDGRFHSRQDSTSYYGDALYGSSQYSTGSKNSGNWRVIFEGRPFLRVEGKRGPRTAELDYREGYFFLGDMPYRAIPNTLCP